MSVTISGDTGVSKVQDGVIVQADLASGVAGNGPAFSATQDTAQSVSSQVTTKILYSSEDFDTNNNYSSSRFTPTVAGYYQINWTVILGLAVNGGTMEFFSMLYRSGAQWVWGTNVSAATNHYTSSTGSAVVYLNGSTDYVEIYAFHHTGGTASVAPTDGGHKQRFSAALVRAA